MKTCCLNWALCNNPITLQCCFPCCLPLKYVDNHLLPCCGFVAGRVCNTACCEFAISPYYYDCTFPPCFVSVGLLDCCHTGSTLIDLLCLPIFTPINCCCSVGTHWKRAGQGGSSGASAVTSAMLFKDGIKPTDVCQGQNGDCWLLAGIAAVAEEPERIEAIPPTPHTHTHTHTQESNPTSTPALKAIFVNQEANAKGGPYRVKLYDVSKRR